MNRRILHTHTHTHTHTSPCKCGLRRAKGRRLCASGVISPCENPAMISDWIRDGRAMAGGVSRSATAAKPSGGRKRKGETPTGGFGMVSTVSCPSRQARETVERCCNCTRHSTCSTTGPSARASGCRNSGWQCTGCYFWWRCKNWGRLMLSPTTTRGLLGHFPWGADPPTNDRRATTLPVRSPESVSLRAILASRDGGRSAWAGASGRRAMREVGRGGAGGDDSKGWSGEIGSSDATSDADSGEGEEEPAPLTALPWGTQESGARGQRVDERAGGSGGGKVTSGTADRG